MATAALAMATPVEKAALTTGEAAVYIGMSRSWLEHSDVPRVRLGKAVRYLVKDLDAYLLQRRDRERPSV